MEPRERHWETLLVALVLALCVRMKQCDVCSGEAMRVREVRHLRKRDFRSRNVEVERLSWL